jgi:hypothetical protein
LSQSVRRSRKKYRSQRGLKNRPLESALNWRLMLPVAARQRLGQALLPAYLVLLSHWVSITHRGRDGEYGKQGKRRDTRYDQKEYCAPDERRFLIAKLTQFATGGAG